MFVYPNLHIIFLNLFTFLFFLFFPMLSTFKPLNALYSKFERLKNEDIRDDFCATEIRGARLEDSPQSGPPNF